MRKCVNGKWATAVAVVCVVSLASLSLFMVSLSNYRRNHAELLSLQVANQADSVFRSDTLQRRLVRYFDRYAYTPDGILHPGRTANDRLLAHYLLGRAYADMGDAPMAIKEYLQAIELADTLSDKCNYTVVRGVYGQLAQLYHKQDMPESEVTSWQGFRANSLIIGDSLSATTALYYMTGAYLVLCDTVNVLATSNQAHEEFLGYGYVREAASVWPTAIYVLLVQGRYDEAKAHMDEYEQLSGLFEEDGTIKSGCETYYASQGLYYLGINDFITSEKCFRKALKYGKKEEAYSGLLSVYTKLGLKDSVALYATLYTQANDASYQQRNAHDIILMREQFRYDQHQQQAQKVEKRNRILIWTSIIVFAVLVFTFFYSVKKKRRVKDLCTNLNNASEHIVSISKKMQSAESEITTLKDIIQKKEITHNVQLNVANDMVQELQEKCNNLKQATKSDAFHLAPIVRQFKSKAEKRTSIPTDSQWNDLEKEFQKAYPKLYQKINTQFTNLQKRVCLLMVIDVSNKDIAFLMNKTPHDITSYGSSINMKMFNVKGATGLRTNLHDVLRNSVKK